MNFDKINFVLDILSSDTVLGGHQNYIKLYVADSIAETSISTVEYKITLKDGRNDAIIVQDYTELTMSGAFYESEYNPELTKEGQLELTVKITDSSSNIYILKDKLQGVL